MRHDGGVTPSDDVATATARTAAAYDARAAEYTALLGSMEATAAEDRALVEAWAGASPGPLLDLGCGPGHWSAHLAARGHEITGMDPSAEFLAEARRAHPSVRFVPGGVFDLDPAGQRFGGILAWYSLIHLPPAQLPAALARVHAALRPGGSLLVGFFDAEPDGLAAAEPFDHAVTSAYRWPAASMASLLVAAGFTVGRVEQRTDPAVRPHAAVLAIRSPSVRHMPGDT